MSRKTPNRKTQKSLTVEAARAQYVAQTAASANSHHLLLDVNVWKALFDDAHVASAQANALIETPGVAIATCPLVANGVIRVLNKPSYGRRGSLGLQRKHTQLTRACAALDHQFWPDDVTLRDDSTVDFNRVHRHHQITDLYLLALAVRHGGTLFTFDQNIPLSAVRGAESAHLRVL
jgi:predicted nucleic acid-binding protein